MTNTIESIDLQIKELQEQKSRLLEKKKTEEEKVFFDVTEIITAANQRLHKGLIDAGVEECEVLSISTNQMRLLEDHEMIRLNVKTSEDKRDRYRRDSLSIQISFKRRYRLISRLYDLDY